MVTCPGCRNTLPDWAQKCQFCGYDVSKVPRSAPAPRPQAYVKPVNTWVMTAYYAISVWYILSGMRSIATTLLESKKEGSDEFAIVYMVFGAIGVLVGLGLLLRIEVVRNIVVFFAGLAVILDVFALFGTVVGTMFSGLLGLLATIFILIDIFANALMIYLIGETASRPPAI